MKTKILSIASLIFLSYGLLAASAHAQSVNLSGSMVGLVAVGGETTGYGLQQSDRSVVEMDLLTNGLSNEFFEGRAVTVGGHFELVTGVEIPVRQVLVVESIDPEQVSATGTVIDMTGLDGCGFMISLDNGDRLEVALPSEFRIEGLRVEVVYRVVPRISICMAGQTAELTSIKKI